MKLVFLLTDICVSFALSIISYDSHRNGSGHGHAAGALIVFVLFGVLYIGVVVVYFLLALRKGSFIEKALREHGILIGFGGLCYLITDNLPPIIEKNGDVLNCGPGCVRNIQIAGAVLFGVAIVTYLPISIDGAIKKKEENKKKEKDSSPWPDSSPLYSPTVPCRCKLATVLVRDAGTQTEHKKVKQDIAARIAGLLLLAKSTNLDLVYTAIERAAPNTCGQDVLVGSWFLWGFYLIYFIVITTVFTFFAIHGMHKYKVAKKKKKCILAVITAVLITVFVACYTLADNKLPLDCSGNSTFAQDVARLCLWGGTVLTGIVLMIFVGVVFFEKDESNEGN